VQKRKFPSINISSQNCLSLNISTKNNKTDLKILALTKSNHEIVLLCDIRLNSLKQSAAIHDLEKKEIIPDCKSSTIPHSLSSKLLDHKQISLNFKTERKSNIQKIKDTILKDKNT
jgi:hypothetical protein